jgi:hypothetical protein
MPYTAPPANYDATYLGGAYFKYTGRDNDGNPVTRYWDANGGGMAMSAEPTAAEIAARGDVPLGTIAGSTTSQGTGGGQGQGSTTPTDATVNIRMPPTAEAFRVPFSGTTPTGQNIFGFNSLEDQISQATGLPRDTVSSAYRMAGQTNDGLLHRFDRANAAAGQTPVMRSTANVQGPINLRAIMQANGAGLPGTGGTGNAGGTVGTGGGGGGPGTGGGGGVGGGGGGGSPGGGVPNIGGVPITSNGGAPNTGLPGGSLPGVRNNALPTGSNNLGAFGAAHPTPNINFGLNPGNSLGLPAGTPGANGPSLNFGSGRESLSPTLGAASSNPTLNPVMAQGLQYANSQAVAPNTSGGFTRNANGTITMMDPNNPWSTTPITIDAATASAMPDSYWRQMSQSTQARLGHAQGMNTQDMARFLAQPGNAHLLLNPTIQSALGGANAWRGTFNNIVQTPNYGGSR